jgi:hypothetical protein
MKKILFMLFTVVILSACGLMNGNADSLTCIRVSNIVPVFDQGGKLITYDSSVVLVYFYKDMRLYDLDYLFDSTREGRVVLSERRRHYFGFQKGKDTGYDFDMYKSAVKIPVSVDSMMEVQWIARNDANSILSANVHTMESSKRDGDSLRQTYTLRNKSDSSVIGTVNFVFAKGIPDAVDISLSKHLDSIAGMRLVRSKFVSFERFARIYNMTLPQFEMSNEMSVVPIKNRDEILSYFKEL